MHGNTPARDSIENAFAAAVAHGQIKAWEPLPGYGPHAKWRVTLNSGAVGPQGGSDMEIRTYQEGKLVAAALASAHFGSGWSALDMVGLIRTAGELWEQTDFEQHPELSTRQRDLLDRAAHEYRELAGDDHEGCVCRECFRRVNGHYPEEPAGVADLVSARRAGNLSEASFAAAVIRRHDAEARGCPDPETCRAQACPEHQQHHGGECTPEQHHSPNEHVGGGECLCNVYRSTAQPQPAPSAAPEGAGGL